MTLDLKVVNGIGKATAEKMKENGINTIEKLASLTIEDLLKISGIGNSNAKRYIETAKKCLESIKEKEKKDKLTQEEQPPKVSKSEVPSVNTKISSENSKSVMSISSRRTSEEKKFNMIKEEIPKPVKSEKKVIEGKTSFNIEKQLLNPINYRKSSNVLKTPERRRKPLPKYKEKGYSEKKTKFKPKTTKKRVSTKKSAHRIKKEQKTSESRIQTFFSEETMQRIRFLHFKIKHLEKILEKNNEDITLSQLNHFYEYIKVLNINYKTQSQIKIFKELNITPNFYDPVENRKIQIWDLMYECTRALWVLATIYAQLSKNFEDQNKLNKAIVTMVECSKIYKTAVYFSTACTRQEDKGTVLEAKNLELNSEESRIFAQNLAAKREEQKENFSLASKLYAGLSALTKRLYFLKIYDKIKEHLLKAQFNYDMGKACQLEAHFLTLISDEDENVERKENLLKKANYYYLKTEDIWEKMVKNFEELSNEEKENLRINLSIVNENIMENDVEEIDSKKAKRIQDPEPFIAIPENLAIFIPRTTKFLTKFDTKDLGFHSYKQYKNLISELMFDYSQLESLLNKKAALGRTIKELRVLYGNNDIDINIFTDLFEKYSMKLQMIETAIKKLKNPEKDNELNKKNIKTSKSKI